jgi:serine O-acetyltransferase
MDLTLNIQDLSSYIESQLINFFPDGGGVKIEESTIIKVLSRLEYCFSKIRMYRSNSGNLILFNHLHSDQYLTFLWYLSNQLWKEGHLNIATKVYYLNKALHAFDCMYNNNLPSIFYVAHGVGIVLGKATYADYLYVCKGVTVGASRGGKYPIIKEGVSLGADSTVIGELTLEIESTVGAGVCLFNQSVGTGMAVVREQSGRILNIKQTEPLSNYIFLK